MIKDKLSTLLGETLADLGFPGETPQLEASGRAEQGDYSTSVALRLAERGGKKAFKSPRALAEAVKERLEQKGLGSGELDFLARVEAAGRGYVNFFLAPAYLLARAQAFARGAFDWPPYSLGEANKVIFEFAHPNTHKLFHLGHLRNIVLGESLSRIFEALGNEVVRANYQGDVGLHIAKCLYGIEELGVDPDSLKTLPERMGFLGEAYAKGSQAYAEDEETKQRIADLNRRLYEKDPKIMPIFEKTRQWSLDYFAALYRRLDTTFDRLYFESEVLGGEEIARQALKNGILVESEGAIVFPGEAYGLDTRVFISSQGLPTYEAKELKLARLEFSEFGRIDQCIHVVGPEQRSFFQVTFKVEELLDPATFKGRQRHLSYGYVRLKSGKMSSRQGTVVEANWLLDEVKAKIKKAFAGAEETAEAVAVAAVKYSMLKVSRRQEIAFDPEESISLEGNSGPYLQYTYARTQGVLNKAGNWQGSGLDGLADLERNREEEALLRMMARFPEVVHEAGGSFAPNLICTYLFELAQKYNLFYQKHPILPSEGERRRLRLLITQATGAVIKRGLDLLGIQALSRM
jgi:arginyl-tRNA synthetase